MGIFYTSVLVVIKSDKYIFNIEADIENFRLNNTFQPNEPKHCLIISLGSHIMAYDTTMEPYSHMPSNYRIPN